MQQRKDEWFGKQSNIEYHERQFKTTYRSTVAFCDFLEEIGYLHKDSKLMIMDLASGAGANISYMGKRYPQSTFIGVDFNPDLVMLGNKFFKDNKIDNCHLEVGDIYKLDEKYVSVFDGIVSLQTLSWLPEFQEPIDSMASLKAKWISLSSLFFDGHVSATIDLRTHDKSLEPAKDCFYNIYSLPVVERYLSEKGYAEYQLSPFEIDIDLPEPDVKAMGTYTVKLENGSRLQKSGPLLMPWYFIAARKQ